MFQKSQNGDKTPPGFFSNLGDRERMMLFNTGTIRNIAENEQLFTKGASGKTIYFVLTGALKAESRDLDKPAFRFRAGDLIGETFLLADKGRVSSVAAETPATVFCLDYAGFETLGADTRSTIIKKLHDAVLSRMVSLGTQNELALVQGAALSGYIKKSRASLEKYSQSEIILNILKNIPTLPLHMTQLIELLTDGRASAKEVAALAKQDPSLVVDILKAINSARYALQTEVTDVSYAVMYMGFNEVYQIALSRGIMKSLPNSAEFREVYRHSLVVSCIASELCHSYDAKKAALLSTIGLLHDIGETVRLLLRKQNPKWSLFIDMLDAARLGAMLLEHWRIPRKICDTIEYQEWPLFCPPAMVPSDQIKNIALLYTSHVVYSLLCDGPVQPVDQPFLDDYLHLLRFDSYGIDKITYELVIPGLMKKSQRLPNFVRKLIATASRGELH